MSDEISVCVALLHDVVEDTPFTFEDLIIQGISAEVVETLKLLTHDDDVLYMDYIKRIKDNRNEAAIAVKSADSKHNSDVSRLDAVDEKVLSCLEKYRAAIEFLENE